MPLTATVETPTGQTDPKTFQIRLRITNPTSEKIAILNPDMGVPSPAMHWAFSQQVYQTSLLLSFGYLSISLTGPSGEQLPREPIPALATPVLRPPLELAPGHSLDLEIPLGTLYHLKTGKYQLQISYGDDKLKIQARAGITVP